LGELEGWKYWNWIKVAQDFLKVCETWSLILREESRIRVYEIRVLRAIFGPKRDEVTGEWKKLYVRVKGVAL
jgi:hypothetical protein